MDMLHVPQNNIKIYIGGELAYTGSLGGKLGTETSFDLDHLERRISSVFPPVNDGSSIGTMVRLLCQILHKEKVLPNLREIQRMDYLDIEAIHCLYKMLKENPSVAANEWDETTLRVFGGDTQERERFMGQLKRGQLREADMVEAIRDYLISMTAKDCSIMITMLPAEQQDSKPPHIDDRMLEDEEAGGRAYVFRVAVVDVDPKPVENIPYWYRLDQEIVEHFIKAIQQEQQQHLPRCLHDHDRQQGHSS